MASRINLPVLEWCAPPEPVDPKLYNAYLDTHGRAQYKPGGERKRWHEFTRSFNQRVAWYVQNGIPQAEAEERVRAVDVHQRELDKLRARQEQWRRHTWQRMADSATMLDPMELDFPITPRAAPAPEPLPLRQRQQDLIRIRHAIESLGKLAESGHPEYLPYYLLARETPIKIVPWAGRNADAQTNPFYDCIYLTRGVVKDQDDLVTQIVHEIQHVYDWHWRFTMPIPLEDEEGRATPLETAAGQDYIGFVCQGEISEEGLPREARQPVGPKEPES